MAEAATIERPYAQAVFLAASEAKTLPQWSQALAQAAAMSLVPQVVEMVGDPNFANERIVALFAGLGGAEIDRCWQNFVKVLAENKRLELFGEIAAQYELKRAEADHELDVEVTSAVALSAQQQASMTAALEKRFRCDVRMTNAVDASLLGGAVIRAGDQVIDGSIKGRLERLATQLAS